MTSSTAQFSYRGLSVTLHSMIDLARAACIVECAVIELAGGDKRLRPPNWKSGDRSEVVEIVAPFGGGRR